MKRFVLIVTIYLLMVGQPSYALDAKSNDKKSKRADQTIACPSKDFYSFIQSFVNNVEIQRAFTKTPLENKFFKLNTHKKPIFKTQNLNLSQIQFPIIPPHEELVPQGFSYYSVERSDHRAKVILFKIDSGHQVFYEFIKNDCWLLVSIEDQSLSADGILRSDWIEALFTSGTPCLPGAFFYDKKTKRTNNGILENLGYSPYLVDEYTARFKVSESFYGLTASEILIPSGTFAVFAVYAPVDVQTLSNAIYNQTGKRIQIHTQETESKHGVPYLFQTDENTAVFGCDKD